MNIRPKKYDHFDAIHLGDTSTFTSRFPIDKGSSAEVKEALRALPTLTDDIFLIRGASETFETSRSGSIPLQPHITSIALNREQDPGKKYVTTNRHLIFKSLTDGAELSTAYLQFDREDGNIRDLSLICQGQDSNGDVSVELRAVINDPHENVFEVAYHSANPAVERDSLLIDEEIASNFVHALRENQAGCEVPNSPIEVGLLELIEKSKHYGSESSGMYFVNGDKNLRLQISREQKIKKGVARTCNLLMQLEETSLSPNLETIRNFTIKIEPDLSARLDFLVRSLDGKIGPEDRAAMFEELSVHLRNNPDIVISGLADSAARLARLS